MRLHVLTAALAAAAIGPLLAQTHIDLRTQAKSIDFSNASTTKPSKTGTALPATCAVGETFLKTDAAPGQNFYVCTAVNVWTVQTGSQAVSSVFGRVAAVAPQTGDYTAAQVTNAVDKTAATTYTAGARQTFLASTGASGLRVAPGVLPASPQIGDLAVDSGDANRAKIFDGASWVSMTTVPNYFTSFSSASTVTIPGTVHKMNTANLVVDCYDNANPANRVEPDSIRVNPVTYDVAVNFAVPQTGRLVINAAGGGGSSGAEASATLDFPNIATGGCAAEQTFALPGASPGDEVAPGWPSGFETGLIGMMRITAADTVAVRVCNLSGSPVNPAVATYRARVVRNF